MITTAIIFIVSVLVSLLLAWAYLLPGRISLNKNYAKTGWLMLLNIFFGWTIIGWFAAFVWSLTAPRTA